MTTFGQFHVLALDRFGGTAQTHYVHVARSRSTSENYKRAESSPGNDEHCKLRVDVATLQGPLAQGPGEVDLKLAEHTLTIYTNIIALYTN